MPVPSVNAAVGWKSQTAKGSAATGAFYWHKQTSSSFMPVELVQPFPPELGGDMLPSGLYKGAYWTAGSLNMVPRVDQALGWLLWSFSGSGAISGAGPYMHTFPGQQDNFVPEKWLTFRRRVPKVGGTYFGETFQDCKVNALTINGTPGSILTMRADVAGLSSTVTDPCSGEGWTPSTDNGGYDAFSGAPITCVSGFEMPDGTPITLINSVTITLNNNAPDPRQMLVIGNYSPVDIIPLSRTITIEATAFWEDAVMYKNIVYGGGTTWTPTLYTGYSPLEIYFQTPGNLAGGAYAGVLGFWAAANAVTWSVRPIDTRGGDIVVLSLQGQVNALTSGEAWRLYLQNAKSTAYS